MSARNPIARAAPYLVVGAAAGFLYFTATQIQYSARPGTLGPDFWPKLVLGLVLIVCAYEIVKAFVLRRQVAAAGVLERLTAGAGATSEVPQPPSEASHRYGVLLAGIALTAAYVALVQKVGFVLATAPYLAAFIVLGGYRRSLVVAASSVIGTLLMVLIFMRVVYVSLPLGEGPFQPVMLWLMQLLGIR